MSRRDATSFAILLFLGGALALFAWATHNPDSSHLERAEEWPGVGGLVAELRRAYRQPEAPVASGDGGGPDTEVIVVPRPGADPLEARPEAAPALAERAWVRPGLALHSAPDETSEVLAEIDHYANPAVFERRGEWARIRHEGQSGWVRGERIEPAGSGPPLGSDPEPPRPLPGRSPDAERLGAALAGLSGDLHEGWVGPYRLYADIDDAALFRRLNLLAGHLEEAYRARYGRQPIGRAAEAVVLFRHGESYRAFQASSAEVAGLPATGHVGAGLVALSTDGRSAEEIGGTLIHELAHLLNRRALGPALPPWLDEGIAEDLSWCRVGPDGRLALGTLGGVREQRELEVTFRGGLAAPLHLARAYEDDRARRLPELLSLDWDRFVRDGRELHYVQAGLWVRFLLDGAGGEHAAGLREFLKGAAAGEPVTPERLAESLGRSWPQLEAAFRIWVRSLARRVEEGM